ncbi:hypothetical protein C8R47DRAFT_597957 [Mycena vitilis]|nr:hypothetical protein C8R47DRAFT_597957 [Mycena vitilis]
MRIASALNDPALKMLRTLSAVRCPRHRMLASPSPAMARIRGGQLARFPGCSLGFDLLCFANPPRRLPPPRDTALAAARPRSAPVSTCFSLPSVPITSRSTVVRTCSLSLPPSPPRPTPAPFSPIPLSPPIAPLVRLHASSPYFPFFDTLLRKDDLPVPGLPSTSLVILLSASSHSFRILPIFLFTCALSLVSFLHRSFGGLSNSFFITLWVGPPILAIYPPTLLSLPLCTASYYSLLRFPFPPSCPLTARSSSATPL